MQVVTIATSSCTTTGGARAQAVGIVSVLCEDASVQGHDATCRQGLGHPARERGMRNQVRGTQPANRRRTPSRINGEWIVSELWGNDENVVRSDTPAPSSAFFPIELAKRNPELSYSPSFALRVCYKTCHFLSSKPQGRASLLDARLSAINNLLRGGFVPKFLKLTLYAKLHVLIFPFAGSKSSFLLTHRVGSCPILPL